MEEIGQFGILLPKSIKNNPYKDIDVWLNPCKPLVFINLMTVIEVPEEAKTS